MLSSCNRGQFSCRHSGGTDEVTLYCLRAEEFRLPALQDGGLDSDKGTVEFIARFKVSGRAERLHEVSRFEKQDDHWLYCDGELLE